MIEEARETTALELPEKDNTYVLKVSVCWKMNIQDNMDTDLGLPPIWDRWAKTQDTLNVHLMAHFRGANNQRTPLQKLCQMTLLLSLIKNF